MSSINEYIIYNLLFYTLCSNIRMNLIFREEKEWEIIFLVSWKKH